MTRRGSIAYYLAAVVCGCFFLAVTYHAYFLATGAPAEHWARDFFFVYFFSILLGLLPQLLTAFFLRRLATRFTWTRAWQWMAAGTAVALAVLWVFAMVGKALDRWHGAEQLRTVLLFGFIGPVFMSRNPLWLPIPAVAATAWVMFAVHRAFEPRAEGTAQSAGD